MNDPFITYPVPGKECNFILDAIERGYKYKEAKALFDKKLPLYDKVDITMVNFALPENFFSK